EAEHALDVPLPRRGEPHVHQPADRLLVARRRDLRRGTRNIHVGSRGPGTRCSCPPEKLAPPPSGPSSARTVMRSPTAFARTPKPRELTAPLRDQVLMILRPAGRFLTGPLPRGAFAARLLAAVILPPRVFFDMGELLGENGTMPAQQARRTSSRAVLAA